MTHDERLWWTILDLADTVSELCFRENNTIRGMAAMNVANRARKTLRDEFKVNLDTLDDEARPRFEALVAQEIAKAQAEVDLMKRFDDAGNLARELLERK